MMIFLIEKLIAHNSKKHNKQKIKIAKTRKQTLFNPTRKFSNNRVTDTAPFIHVLLEVGEGRHRELL